MDGPVDVTDDQLRLVVQAFTARLAKFAEGAVPMKECPPMQVDHTSSAHDTVGRLTGPLSLEEMEIDGEMRLALVGFTTVLGKENVEKVLDGRWTNLSVGCDFDTGEIKELTITPFPAAAHAALFSQPTRLGEGMDAKAKLKKHLMENDKLSEKDADEKLSKMSEDDAKKELSRMAAEDEEKAKLAADEEEKKKLAAEESEKDEAKKLALRKERLTRLSARTVARAADGGVRLARAQVMVRLSKLKADAKITPAEIKKIDVEKLAKLSSEARNAVLASYDSREPVIHIGTVGSVKALDPTAMMSAQSKKKFDKLYAESRGRFTSLGPVDPAAVNATPPAANPAPLSGTGEETSSSGLTHELVSSHLATCMKHLEEGDHEACMRHLKHLSDLWGKHLGEGMPAPGDKVEHEMSSLSRDFDALVKLVTETQELAATLVA